MVDRCTEKKQIVFLLLFSLNCFIFMVVLGLHCYVRALSGFGKWGLLFLVVLRLLIAVACLVAEHRL